MKLKVEKIAVRKMEKALFIAALLLFGALLLIFPQRYTQKCYGAICLWAENIVPSLFPFMIISALLIASGFTERISAPLAPLSRRLNLPRPAIPLFIISCLSGYPAGSRSVAQYSELNLISKKDAQKLSILCSTSGPLFIIGTVGVKAFGDFNKGLILLVVCHLVTLLSSVAYYLTDRTPTEESLKICPLKRGDMIAESFYGAVTAILTAGSFIVFFCTLSAAFQDIKLFAPIEYVVSPVIGKDCAEALCRGFIEATGGCFALAKCKSFFALPLTGFLLTFGGISIIMQQLVYFKKCGVKTSFFVIFKLLQGTMSFIVLCIIQLLCRF